MATDSTVPVRPFSVTHRGVLAIAVPMTLAYLTTPVVGVTDMAVIGRLGDAAVLGAVALGAVLFNFIGTTFNFLRMGTTGLTAQAFGDGDEEAQRATLVRALILAGGLGGAAVLLQAPILAVFLELMGASADVNAATGAYFRVRVLGVPLQLANYAILGWLLGLGQAGRGLVLQLILGITNVVLSIVFVLVLGFGVEGVAAASVLAEFAALVSGIVVVRLTIGKVRLPAWGVVMQRRGFVRMLAVNRDIMIRSLVLISTFTFFAAQGARSGDVILAANALLMNFFLVGSFFLDGLATAAEQLSGRAVGANYRPAFDRALRLTIGWGFVVAACLSLLFYAGGGALIDLMTTADGVREAARVYLVWAALTPLVGALAFQMDGVFIGATWSDDMRNMMLVSFAAFLLVWWFAAEPLGNHGLWLALLVFLGLRGLTLLWRCRGRIPGAFPATAAVRHVALPRGSGSET